LLKKRGSCLMTAKEKVREKKDDSSLPESRDVESKLRGKEKHCPQSQRRGLVVNYGRRGNFKKKPARDGRGGTPSGRGRRRATKVYQGGGSRGVFYHAQKRVTLECPGGGKDSMGVVTFFDEDSQGRYFSEARRHDSLELGGRKGGSS